MNMEEQLPVERFLQTLSIVAREGDHLIYSWKSLYSQPINAEWVRKLETNPELAERLEAFISRYGRMQDTIAEKLLSRWLLALNETPGSQIETLNRAERLGVVENVDIWLEARKLRNSLVHEYMEDPVAFARYLVLAKDYSFVLLKTFNLMRDYALTRMGLQEAKIPRQLELPKSA